MSGQQLFLFEPRNTALIAFQLALQNLDLAAAVERLVSLKTVWPDCGLDREEELLTRLPGLLSEPMLPDAALLRWEEFIQSPLARSLAPSLLKRLEGRFLAILLEVNEFPISQARTPEGRSVGWLCWKAGRREEARKRLVLEIQRFPDDPAPRVRLANCHFESGDRKAARINYREALLIGFSQVDPDQFADRVLAKFLDAARRELGEWAVIDACLEDVLPLPCMMSVEELDRFRRRFPASAESPDQQVLRFYCCLVISANRQFIDAGTLLEARTTMRLLHPRMHLRHMRMLESQAGH